MANSIPERAEFDENVDLGDHDELLIWGNIGNSSSRIKFVHWNA